MRDDIIYDLTIGGIIGKGLKARPKSDVHLKKNPDLLAKLIQSTCYLPKDSSTHERLLNIRLGIFDLKYCNECGGSLAGRINKSTRMYHRFCKADCRHSFVTKERVKSLMIEIDGTSKIKQMAQRQLARELSTIIDGKNLMQIRLEKALKTRIANKHCIDRNNPSQVSAQQKYRMEVQSITYKQPIHLLKNIEKRGAIDSGGWHLDHRYSINQGFLNGVPPEVIGNICNLEMIPAIQNVTKQEKSSITLEHLMSEYNQQSLQQEFLTTSYDHQPAES